MKATKGFGVWFLHDAKEELVATSEHDDADKLMPKMAAAPDMFAVLEVIGSHNYLPTDLQNAVLDVLAKAEDRA